MSDSQSPSSKPKRSRNYKIVILGDGGVGKSALTMQFVCHRFLDYHDPTIEDAYQKQANIDGEPAMLDILDTAGQPEFTAMRDQYMRNGEGFMLCYSVIDRRSFNAVLENKNLVERVRNRDDIPLVLVGNKCDLRSKRVIPIDEGQEMARKLGCPFFETSAALRHYVDDAFHGMVREIRKREREIQVAEVKRQKEKNRRQRLANFLHHLNIGNHNRSKNNSP